MDESQSVGGITSLPPCRKMNYEENTCDHIFCHTGNFPKDI